MKTIFCATIIHLITYGSITTITRLKIEEIETPFIDPSQIKHNNVRSMFSDPKTISSKTSSAINGGMCDGYKGILMISSGDIWAAAGTSFFLYPINQILYAERNNLILWANFTAKESQIYNPPPPLTDDDGNPIAFQTQIGSWITKIRSKGGFFCMKKGVPYRGPPEIKGATLHPKMVILETSGVWEHYFEPLSAFRPERMTTGDRKSCGVVPFLELTMGQLEQGTHVVEDLFYAVASGGDQTVKIASDESKWVIDVATGHDCEITDSIR